MGQAKKVEGREFLFKIALALGRTVEELSSSMSWSEYMEWQEYYNKEPFHQDRQEIQMAVLTKMVSSQYGGKSKVADFIITGKTDTSEPSLSIEEMSAEDINKLAGVL